MYTYVCMCNYGCTKIDVYVVCIDIFIYVCHMYTHIHRHPLDIRVYIWTLLRKHAIRLLYSCIKEHTRGTYVYLPRTDVVQ